MKADSNIKAVALMSGGLDSTLAAKVVKDLGVEVVGLHLVSPFGCREEVKKSADAVGIPLLFKEKGESYLDLVENPRYGYGKNLNPCIDCRIFMFELADVVRQDIGADFIVTGEVVGQRPMSQQRHSMSIIDKNSPLERLVLRPLSAHCMPPTIPEEKGWIDREALFAISGRGRAVQMQMAADYGIRDYSAPGGGCLLTESAFSTRLRDFFDNKQHTTSEERLSQSQLLRLGRHFRISPKLKVIIGRNQGENEEMHRLWKKAGAVHLHPSNFDGPSAVAVGAEAFEKRETIGAMIVRYSSKAANLERKEITFSSAETTETFCITSPISEETLEGWRL